MTARAVLLVQGADLSCYALADVRVTVGRQSVYEQTEAATLNARIVQTSVQGTERPAMVGDPVELWAATGTGDPDWRLFAGRATDIAAAQVPAPGGGSRWELNITAAGPMAEVARTSIGDAPWPVETDSARIHRILGVAGYDQSGVDPSAHGPKVMARDVDRQPVLRLLHEVARAGGGLLWEDHAAGIIRYQPRIDRGGGTGTWDGIGGTWDDADQSWADGGGGGQAPPHIIDGCAVRSQPWRWESRVGQLVTYCQVKYGDDRAAEAGSLDPPVYALTVDTVLANSADAQALADSAVYLRATPRWHAPTITLHANRLGPAGRAQLPDVIVGGSPITVPTPPGSPSGTIDGYLEGWTHRLAAGPGGVDWFIELAVSERALTEVQTLWDTSAPLTWDTANPRDTWNTPRLTGAAA